MGRISLGFAAAIAVVAIAVPANAGTPEEPFVGIPGANNNPPVFSGGGFQLGTGSGFHDGSGFGDRRRRGTSSSSSSSGIWVNGGEWARYNNQTFKSDGFNDWWHDQPWRSQPAWVRNNQQCQMYWSGGGWRC